VKNFCSVADVNFYDRAYALDHSLSKFGDDYRLHLLCLDDEIYNKINNKKNIFCYRLSDLITSDVLLQRSINNPPSREALINSHGDIEKGKKLQFIWSLSSYFSWWCLEKLDVENILYIDADIYFYSDYHDLYDHLTDCSVGIVEHRCPYNPANGKYNVGIVYFKNNFDGYKCSTWWKNCLLLTTHDYYETHSCCGDQKYLELFAELFNDVKVLDPFIGHLAPWNFNFHSYAGDNIIWQGQKQKLLYCHFSNFGPDYINDTYKLAARHGIIFPPNEFIKKLADQYYSILRRAND